MTMRPIVSNQNSLRNPLNELLGKEANMRLLRVPANDVKGPLAESTVAERAGLTIPAAHKALKRLLQSGFVARVGGGRKHQYELRRSDFLRTEPCAEWTWRQPVTREQLEHAVRAACEISCAFF